MNKCHHDNLMYDFFWYETPGNSTECQFSFMKNDIPINKYVGFHTTIELQ